MTTVTSCKATVTKAPTERPCRSCGSTSRPVHEFGGDHNDPRAGGSVKRCASCRAPWDAAAPIESPIPEEAPTPVVRLVPLAQHGAPIVAQITARLTAIDAELARHNELKIEARQLRRMLKAAKTT